MRLPILLLAAALLGDAPAPLAELVSLDCKPVPSQYLFSVAFFP